MKPNKSFTLLAALLLVSLILSACANFTGTTGTATPGAATQPANSGGAASGDFKSGWSTDWYWSPFRDTTDELTDEATRETFAEPGVLLNDTAAFDYLSANETPANAPEGAYLYVAVGAMSLTYDGARLSLLHQDENIYLVIVRGLPDDGGPADLNQIVMLGDYVRGAGIYSPMPAGAYVSLGWFEQQIVNAGNDPNCGGDGCERATVVVVDLKTKTYRMWTVNNPTGAPSNWSRVQ